MIISNEFEGGLLLDDPCLNIPWDITPNQLVKHINVIEINANYYLLKGLLYKIPFINLFGLHFINSKLYKIEMFSNEIQNKNAKSIFAWHQNMLENNFGKCNKNLFDILYVSNDIIVHEWKFKTSTLVHMLRDRFGIEEILELIAK